MLSLRHTGSLESQMVYESFPIDQFESSHRPHVRYYALHVSNQQNVAFMFYQAALWLAENMYFLMWFLNTSKQSLVYILMVNVYKRQI